MRRWLIERFGIVRLRQIAENVRHRLSFLPIMLVLAAVVLSQITLAIDRRLGEVDLPQPLQTSVDSSRPVLATIAGALITTVTLLLSMMLVAIQLASGNFSPRTLRNWLGDRTLRWSIAIVLATTVFCLMALRSVRTGPDNVDNPTVTVLLAVVFALGSLIAVIRAVDHVAGNMQVGTVADRLVASTIETLDHSRESFASRTPTASPALTPGDDPADESDVQPDPGAIAVEAATRGFVQQIDERTLLEALPDGAVAWLAVSHGDFVTSRSPLVYVTVPDHVDPDSLSERTEDEASPSSAIARAFALGQTRTMQQDVGFGLAQLSDIAVRALSPGINDPETASGIVLNLGEVLREIWSREPVEAMVESDGRTIHRRVATHEHLLRAALDPIRRHGRSEPSVLITVAKVVGHLRAEAERCDLPGPHDPLDDFLADLAASADTNGWLERERVALKELTRS